MKISLFAVLLFYVPSIFAAQSDLIGMWRSKDKKESMEFTADGRVVSQAQGVGVTGRYECPREGELILKFEGNGAPPPLPMNYAIDGQTLKLKGPEGREVEFSKVKKSTNSKQ